MQGCSPLRSFLQANWRNDYTFSVFYEKPKGLLIQNILTNGCLEYTCISLIKLMIPPSTWKMTWWEAIPRLSWDIKLNWSTFHNLTIAAVNLFGRSPALGIDDACKISLSVGSPEHAPELKKWENPIFQDCRQWTFGALWRDKNLLLKNPLISEGLYFSRNF